MHTYITTYVAVGGFSQLKKYKIIRLEVIILSPPTDHATVEKPTCGFPALSLSVFLLTLGSFSMPLLQVLLLLLFAYVILQQQTKFSTKMVLQNSAFH